MKISVAQIKPVIGEILKNIRLHGEFIACAAAEKADTIFFPELSLTGYHRELSKSLATSWDNEIFDELQTLSNNHKIIVGAGMPTKGPNGNHISMLVFEPGRKKQVYHKQFLYHAELPYFVNGKTQLIIDGSKKIAPAICYESTVYDHSDKAMGLGAQIYLCSVAKCTDGVQTSYHHYPIIAKKHGVPVLMSNCVGPGDDFIGHGMSGVWNKEGRLLAQLDEKEEALLIFDTGTDKTEKISITPLKPNYEKK